LRLVKKFVVLYPSNLRATEEHNPSMSCSSYVGKSLRVYSSLPDNSKPKNPLMTKHLQHEPDPVSVRYFEECREMKVLDENLELIYAAVKVEWVGAEVQGMNWLITGDVQMAKVVEKTKLRFMKRLIAPR
jgi:hypothetical protein